MSAPVAANPLVIVVDDEPDILTCMQDLVEGMLGYTTLTASSGPDTLRMLEALDPGDVHLLVADYNMHPLNGLEVLEAARRMHPRLPTVLCTAYGDLSLAVEAVNRAHVSRFIPKPVDPDYFMEVVRELVAQARLDHARDAALRRASGMGPETIDVPRSKPRARGLG